MCARDTALQRGIDVGNAADRLQHQHHRAEEGDELAGRKVALERFAAGHEDHQRNAEAEDRLRNGDAHRSHADKLEILLAVLLVDVGQPVALVLVAAEHLHDPVAAHDLVRHLRDFAHRVLDTIAVAPERDAEHPDEHGDDGKQNDDEHGQAGALDQHHAEGREHRQYVANRDRNDTGYGFGDHLDVVGHP